MEIRIYVSRDGKKPFVVWMKKLRDQRARDRIHNQIDRLRLGNTGDFKSVGNGIYELRIHYGPGYRIYFGHTGKQIILLLCGGNKASQPQDVNRAKQYWQEYRRR
jgi:putative addiction module killer protein